MSFHCLYQETLNYLLFCCCFFQLHFFVFHTIQVIATIRDWNSACPSSPTLLQSEALTYVYEL